ncbi:MAG: hypothetical protein ACOX4H_09430 [Bacillota bacterium]|jgi:hypothetical protein|nr:hypothetical protein [Clostridia bacterium]
MDKTLNRHVTIQVSGKVVKTMSWTMCFSLILLLLIGGTVVYGVQYQGMDMPIRLESNEMINWVQLIEEKSKAFIIEDKAQLKDKIIIFKWDLGYLKQAVRIGRGPPSYIFNL